MDNYNNTIRTWDELAQKYEDAFMDLNLYNESYDFFCHYLNKNKARIFEIGCGPGNITKYLLLKSKEFKIHAIDASTNMIALANKNNPTATFEAMDCRNISQIKTTHDAVVCGFCLPYLAKEDFIKLIKDCYSMLEAGGLLYLSCIEGNYEDSNFEQSSDRQHKLFVYYYSEDFITKTLTENDFYLLKNIRIPYKKGNGDEAHHLIFIAKKNQSIVN